jgi:hypothetical protein
MLVRDGLRVLGGSQIVCNDVSENWSVLHNVDSRRALSVLSGYHQLTDTH